MTAQPAPNERRIAFLDVDGTIADAAGRIADSTVRAVREARARGHLVFLSTGRAAPELTDGVLAIGFDGAITAGGGYATIGDELVIARPMPDDLIARMLDVFHEVGCEYYLQTFDEIFPSVDFHRHYGRLLVALGGIAPEQGSLLEHPRVVELLQQVPVPTTGAAKGVFMGGSLETYREVAARLDDRFHVITGTIPGLGGGGGEVSAAGVTKGETIRRLLQLLGIAPSQALGIGDGANDVEMFDVCGVGIAMRDAAAEVRARADEVTTGVLDDGVWNAFVRHGLV